MPPHKAATALLRDYLESRVGCTDKRESAACKAFLRAYNAATSDGNPGGIEIAIVNGAEFNTVRIFCNIFGVGPIAWLPSLVTQGSDKLKHIMRETGANRLNIAPPDRPMAGGADMDGAPRRMVPPKAETRLIPGRPF